MTLVERLARARTPAQKSAASRLLNRYVRSRVALGFNESGVRASIKGAVTRYRRPVTSLS